MNRTLAPKDLGGILSETFTIYKNNFLKFIAIVAMVYIPFVVLDVVAMSLTFTSLDFRAADPSISSHFFGGIIRLVASIAMVIASIWMTGAIIHAVSQQYFYRPVSIGQACSFAWHRLAAMFGAGVIAFLALIGIYLAAVLIIAIFTTFARGGLGWLLALTIIPLFLVAITAIIYIAINWYFVLQAALLEGCGPTSALSRSWALVKGSWWRVLGIILLLILIVQTIIMIFVIPGMIGYFSEIMSGILKEAPGGFTPYGASEFPTWIIWIVIGGAIGNIITLPILIIGETLLYFDLRVRKEGYSLDTLANELGLSSPSTDTTITSPPE